MCLYAITRSKSSLDVSFSGFAIWIPVSIVLAIGSSLVYVSMFGNTSQMIDQRKRNERSKVLLNKFSWVLRISVALVFGAGLLLTGHALIFILLIPVIGILGLVINLDRSRRSMWRRHLDRSLRSSR